MSEISFMGHLMGAVVGVLHTYGVTAPLLPSPQFLRDVEQLPGVSSCRLR
jgi:hypothetical protein